VIKILHAIYVIHQEIGICLIEKIFSNSKIEFDSNLISSYITAFKNYGKEVSKVGELKIINIGIYYILLVIKDPVFIVAVADRKDDKNILHHHLSKLLLKFLRQYKESLENFTGSVTEYKKFQNTISTYLKDGKIGEVKQLIPVLKNYKKSFLKYRNDLITKKLLFKTEDFEEFIESFKDPSWVRERKLPPQTVSQGFFDKRTYNIAHKFNGLNTIDDIMDETGLSKEEITKIIKKLEELNLLDYIEVN